MIKICIIFFFRKHQTKNEMDIYLKVDLICALQEFCISWNWILPKYEFFEEGNSKTCTYSIICTIKILIVEG
jgi:hypothetical protein